MPVKVSVVIPVYNPGPYIEDCIESLIGQSLPKDELEVIFVDDGSTDDSPARLDRLAAEEPNMRVIHQENSGWSGKPRNVGIEAAQGEYVMFVDNDDYLGTEAMERMYDYGVEHGADMVIGKMAGKGRPVPLELFRKNRPYANVENAPLIDSLTPHKMLRRAFLMETGLRYMEGRRRLEDHVFVAEAYLRAKNISVLSDYICYYHIKRDDASNAGFQQFDPVGYFKNLREALDVVERHTEPGPLRDSLFRRWLRNEMVERLRGRRLLRLDPEYRARLYTEIRKVVVERFGPGVAAKMAPTQRIVAGLIVADRLGDIETLAQWEAGVKPGGALERLEWRDGRLELAFTGEFASDGEPVSFLEEDGVLTLAPPLPATTMEAIRLLDTDLGAWVERAKVDLVVRERSTAAEFYQPVEIEREVAAVPDSERRRVVVHGSASIDPATAAGGAALGSGVWDVLIRLHLSGWTKETRLGSVRSEAARTGRRPALVAGRTVLPYWTDPHGNLSLDIDQGTGRLAYDFAEVRAADAAYGSSVSIPTPFTLTEAVDAVLVLTSAATAVELPGKLVPHGPDSVFEADAPSLSAGTYKAELRPGSEAKPVVLPLAAIADGAAVRFEALPAAAASVASAGPARRPQRTGLARRAGRKVKRALKNMGK